MLISFEGIDGCGKSTQTAMLEEWLRKNRREYALFREPGGTSLSEQMRTLLLHSEQKMDPVTELFLFSAARSQLITEKVIPLLKKGTIVILDRFFDSTTAYQGYGRKVLPIGQIEEMNRLAAHQLVPDITFYLKISPSEAEARIGATAKDRIERAGKSFYDNVGAGFDTLASTHLRFHILDASQPPSAIHAEIVEKVENTLAGKAEK